MNTLKSYLEHGLIQAVTWPDLNLNQGSLAYYAGFDPTADSLHIGHLYGLKMMSRLQKLGHRPIAVVGGATGMIGDPSGKSKERVLLTEDVIAKNIKGIKSQIELFLDFNSGARLVNNMDWFQGFGFIEFLRDVGKVFRVSEMIAKESVQKRLDSTEGISFTEFTYQILQAYDFYHLNKAFDCNLQIGGSDQWGNITAGIDLIRKLSGRESYGMTWALLTTSSGQKFGKSEAGTIWLDDQKTSPYQFYQFFLQTEDADVIRFLRYFTDLSEEDLLTLDRENQTKPEARAAQKVLAREVCLLLHGNEKTSRAIRASDLLFGSDSLDGIDSALLDMIAQDLPACTIKHNELDQLGFVDLLVRSSLAQSKNQARQFIAQGSIYLNNQRVTDEKQVIQTSHLLTPKHLLLRSGKRKYALVCVEKE